MQENLGEIPLFIGEPEHERVKKLKCWITKHNDMYKNNYVTMYHGTGTKIPILKEGIKPTSSVARRRKKFGDLGNMSKSKVALTMLYRT